jgi:hypothetical protein
MREGVAATRINDGLSISGARAVAMSATILQGDTDPENFLILCADELAVRVIALRRIRDFKLWMTDETTKANTFREWCMNKFGEGFGRIIDDNL